MTGRSSARVHAQALYREAVAQLTPTLTLPLAGGGNARGEGDESLTERVRKLYEEGAVPVREIARLAGVSERTIYKYAAKHDWKPRYAWAGGGRPQMRGERWRATDAAALGRDVAPARGAGARFVRREERGLPVATGLKATDPQGAACASAACARAQPVADAAWRAAERDRADRELDWSWRQLNRALKALADFREEREKRRPDPLDDRFEAALIGMVCAWTDTVRDWRLHLTEVMRGES